MSLVDDRSDYDRQRYISARKEIHAYLGGACASCGVETADLEVDHITPELKSYSIMSKWSLGLEKLKPELEKCQLLCNVCHKNKSDEALRVPHGGGVSGKRNCKCVPCRAQKNKYMREWKLRNKNISA